MRKSRLFSLEKRRLQEYLVEDFHSLQGASMKDVDRLFTKASSDRTRGNCIKVEEGRFSLDTRKTFFTKKVVRHRNRCPREVVDAPSLESFKVRLVGAVSNLL